MPADVPFDDDGFVDMDAFDGVDPDAVLAPDTLSELQSLMTEPDPIVLSDAEWEQTLDAVFEAAPEPTSVDLLAPLVDDPDPFRSDDPISLEDPGEYGGRSAAAALESTRSPEVDLDDDDADPLAAGDGVHDPDLSLTEPDGLGPDDGFDLGLDTDRGLDEVLSDLDEGVEIDDPTDDDIDLDDAY